MASITIPYAVADFIEMRERGFYYVDKTQYIAKLEDYKAPVFLRPRRFGKSLLVSTLACYYDRTKAHRFEELFGDTWIGNHPTKEHNRYMIIRYDFSAMVMSDHIQGLAQNFNDLNCGPVEVMVAHNRDCLVILNLPIAGMHLKCWKKCLLTPALTNCLKSIF